jgi:hypothetical protein
MAEAIQLTTSMGTSCCESDPSSARCLFGWSEFTPRSPTGHAMGNELPSVQSAARNHRCSTEGFVLITWETSPTRRTVGQPTLSGPTDAPHLLAGTTQWLPI